LPLK
jgi:hypothetical protein